MLIHHLSFCLQRKTSAPRPRADSGSGPTAPSPDPAGWTVSALAPFYTADYVNALAARRRKREDPGKGQRNATCLESLFKNLKSPRSASKKLSGANNFQGENTGLPVRSAPSPVSRSQTAALTPSNMSGVKKLRTVSKSEDNGVTEPSTFFFFFHPGAAIFLPSRVIAK